MESLVVCHFLCILLKMIGFFLLQVFSPKPKHLTNQNMCLGVLVGTRGAQPTNQPTHIVINRAMCY